MALSAPGVTCMTEKHAPSGRMAGVVAKIPTVTADPAATTMSDEVALLLPGARMVVWGMGFSQVKTEAGSHGIGLIYKIKLKCGR